MVPTTMSPYPAPIQPRGAGCMSRVPQDTQTPRRKREAFALTMSAYPRSMTPIEPIAAGMGCSLTTDRNNPMLAVMKNRQQR